MEGGRVHGSTGTGKSRCSHPQCGIGCLLHRLSRTRSPDGEGDSMMLAVRRISPPARAPTVSYGRGRSWSRRGRSAEPDGVAVQRTVVEAEARDGAGDEAMVDEIVDGDGMGDGALADEVVMQLL